ncbi:alpha/beta hydrolase [Kiloniella litopenaei]|uniref:Alpha/beta hydrolase n=1 Tax=Kiloniella litopenaei TaxID=1549748 RepID=A0A0M2RB70_9PROT|nr:alpha/beta hydrolase [Kiloniella litopenaei]KKJ77230.1 alpha/beta hydrolase [Kiloniella litopenaei]
MFSTGKILDNRLWRFLLLCLLLIPLLAACTPRLGPAGELTQAAELTDDYLITDDGLQLPLRIWLPEEKPSVIILGLHGFNDYSNAFNGPGTFWTEAGIATYAYDQRGFGAAPHPGLWGGHERMTSDLRTAARLLRQRHPDTPLYVLGISMGGAVAMAALEEQKGLEQKVLGQKVLVKRALEQNDPTPLDITPLDIDGVILSAPAVWARKTMPWYQRASLWLVAHTTPWASFTGSGLKIQASDNIPMLIDLGKDPLVIKSTRIDSVYGLTDLMDAAYGSPDSLTLPALLLYGEKDEVVPWHPTRDVWKRLPNGIAGPQKAALYPEGWHMLLRDLQAETVLADIASWVKSQTTPLPSGADINAQQKLDQENLKQEAN